MSEDVELLEEQKLQDDDQQRDPALDWFLTHCHLHKISCKIDLNSRRGRCQYFIFLN